MKQDHQKLTGFIIFSVKNDVRDLLFFTILNHCVCLVYLKIWLLDEKLHQFIWGEGRGVP